jgi:hypothetical protein
VLDQRALAQRQETERRSQAILDEVAQTFVSSGDKTGRNVLNVRRQQKQDP